MATRHPAKTRVYLEVGKKKTFAGALDWPGWIRAAKSSEAALEAMDAYAGRYAVVASLAGAVFPTAHEFEVVETLAGNATTDFGAPDVIAASDHEPWTDAGEADRHITLVEASWTRLHHISATASTELRKGPRGGGRDRDEVLAHVVAAEASFGRRIGVRDKAPDPSDRAAVDALRQHIVDDLREPRVAHAKPWPVRYAARRIAWHVLDHAWEIEDKSLA